MAWSAVHSQTRQTRRRLVVESKPSRASVAVRPRSFSARSYIATRALCTVSRPTQNRCWERYTFLSERGIYHTPGVLLPFGRS
jgi:hypothetical protein